MCFGFLWDDGIVNPTPPLWRAMRLVKKALEDAGHTGLYVLFVDLLFN
jgi:amidase